MGDFSQLPEELIDDILKRLSHIEDFVRCEAVCKSWQSVVAATRKTQRQLCFRPYLMLTNDQTDAQNLRTFHCLSSESERRDIAVRLPDIHGRRCWGSPLGWMVTYGLDLNMHLLNPFSGVRFSLPHQSTVPNQYPRPHEVEPEYYRQCCPMSFVLSSAPNPDPDLNQSCFVLGIFLPLGKLSFAKPGDQAWTAIETVPVPWFQNAIYFNGQFVAVDQKARLTFCDIDTPHPKGIRLENPPPHDKFNPGNGNVYLVEMSEELYLVESFRNWYDKEDDKEEVGHNSVLPNGYFIRERFDVYKFDFETKRWIQVFDLGHYALFVGGNTSFVISTYDYPEFKRNAIYYTDDNVEVLHLMNFCDMAVYDFEKKTSEPFYSGANVLSKFSRPVFIVPTL